MLIYSQQECQWAQYYFVDLGQKNYYFFNKKSSRSFGDFHPLEFVKQLPRSTQPPLELCVGKKFDSNEIKMITPHKSATSQNKGDLWESTLTHTHRNIQKESLGRKREESDIRTHYIARYLILSLFYYLYRHQSKRHIHAHTLGLFYVQNM